MNKISIEEKKTKTDNLCDSCGHVVLVNEDFNNWDGLCAGCRHQIGE